MTIKEMSQRLEICTSFVQYKYICNTPPPPITIFFIIPNLKICTSVFDVQILYFVFCTSFVYFPFSPNKTTIFFRQYVHSTYISTYCCTYTVWTSPIPDPRHLLCPGVAGSRITSRNDMCGANGGGVCISPFLLRFGISVKSYHPSLIAPLCRCQ